MGCNLSMIYPWKMNELAMMIWIGYADFNWCHSKDCFSIVHGGIRRKSRLTLKQCGGWWKRTTIHPDDDDDDDDDDDEYVYSCDFHLFQYYPPSEYFLLQVLLLTTAVCCCCWSLDFQLLFIVWKLINMDTTETWDRALLRPSSLEIIQTLKCQVVATKKGPLVV